jgi:hypothetical protein
MTVHYLFRGIGTGGNNELAVTLEQQATEQCRIERRELRKSRLRAES